MKLLRNLSVIGIVAYFILAVILFSSCSTRPQGACYNTGFVGYGYKTTIVSGGLRKSY